MGDRERTTERGPAKAPVATRTPSASGGTGSLAPPTLGNAALAALIRQGGRLGRPDDAQEREARALAERVEGPAPHALPSTPPRPRAGVSSPAVRDLLGSGVPLPLPMRERMEALLAHSFAGVRVHTDAAAGTLARQFHARAFAVGSDVVFADGLYDPHGVEGRRRLAHELVHVRQARDDGAPVVRRDPDARADAREDELVLTDLGFGLHLQVQPGAGRALISYREREWIRLTWHPVPGRELGAPNLTITRETTGPRPVLRLRVNASFRVEATVRRSVEQYAIDYAHRAADVEVRMDFPGSVNDVDEQERITTTSAAPWTSRRSYTASTTTQPIRIEGEGSWERESDPPYSVPNINDPLRTTRFRVWSLSGQAGFDSFATSHPDTNWLGIQTGDGRTLAWALDERSLQAIASQIRQTEFQSAAPLREFPGGRAIGLAIGGRTLETFSELRNLYFASPDDAAFGSSAESIECEIFEMGQRSYGRRPLDHEAALTRWRELDGKTLEEIRQLKTEPDRRFVALQVRSGGTYQYLDYQHFAQRDRLLAFHQRVGPGQASGDLPEDLLRFLDIEVGRVRGDPRIRQLLEAQPDITEKLQKRVLADVERRGQDVAMQSLRRVIPQVRRLATNDEALIGFIGALPQLNLRQRYDALALIGISSMPRRLSIVSYIESLDEDAVVHLMGDAQNARTVVLGATTPKLSLTLDYFRRKAAQSVSDLEALLAQLESRGLLAIRAEGPMGEQVREAVFRDLGFKRLRSNQYPFTEQLGRLPGPLSGEATSFATIGEQLYGNAVARERTGEMLKELGVGLFKAALVVALVLIANAAGAYVAGGILGLETGTAAYTIAQTVSAAAVFTGLDMVTTWLMSGRSPIDTNDPVGSAGAVGKQLALNIAMFGFFQALNSVLTAASSRGVMALTGMSEEAFAASRGAQAVASGARISATGAAFVSMSIAQFVATNNRMPTADEASRIAVDSLLMLVAMEAGGRLARPLMAQVDLWARARALEGLDPALRTRTSTFLADVRRFQAELAAIGSSPQTAARDAATILAREEALLTRQAELIRDLRQSLRTGNAAAQIETQAALELAQVDSALSLLRNARFLGEAGIKPQGTPADLHDILRFTYRAGGLDAIKRFYGEQNVTREADGTLKVRHQGRELVFTPEGSTTAAAPTPPTPVPSATPNAAQQVATRQRALLTRQQALLRRAAALNLLGEPVAQTVRGLRPLQTTSEAGLRRAERLLGTAEGTLAPKMEAIARDALARHVRRMRDNGLSMDNVRTGELASLTDQQVGEALAQVPQRATGLGEPQLRAILYAAKGPPAGSNAEPISIARVFDLARSAAERNHVLDAFSRFMESRTPGAYEVLSSMTASANNWRGGVWMLEYAHMGPHIDRIGAFEVSSIDPLTGGERRYDIVLTDGTRLELKDWQNWFPDSLRSQFRRDILIQTNDFADPEGLRKLQWIFRGPSPESAAVIRDTMRQALEDTIREFGLDPNKAAALRRAFEGHQGLVNVSSVGWGATPPAVVPTPGTTNVAPVQPPRDDQSQAGSPTRPIPSGSNR